MTGAHREPPPEAIGPYTVLEEIAVGGMATVYRAAHSEAIHEVALKVLAVHLASNKGTRRRFEREAEALVQLQHPHILPVYDAGEADGTPYFAMRLLSGQTLDDLLREGPLPPSEAASIIRQMASALDYAHEQGVIHRDVKPGNILLDDDRQPFLSDFGVAHFATRDARMTTTGDFVGTATYASPEQCRGDEIGPASDIYSLAILAFQMLTGDVPFHGNSVILLIKQHLDAPVPDPCAINPALPAALDGVLRKALAKSPADRYASAIRFSTALDRALEIVPRPDGVDDAAWLYDGQPPRDAPTTEPAPEHAEEAPPPPTDTASDPGEDPFAPDLEPDDFFGDLFAGGPESGDAEFPPPAQVLKPPRPPAQPASGPAPRRAPRWERPGVYASLAASLIGLVAALAILASRLVDPAPALGATYRADALGITFDYPENWQAAATGMALIGTQRRPSVVLSDRPVPSGGPYDAATLVVVVQTISPVAVFGVPPACQGDMARGPARTFTCMQNQGYITPAHEAFAASESPGIRLPGALPPTPASYPIILLPGGQGQWIAVIVAHWDGYPRATEMHKRIAASIRALP